MARSLSLPRYKVYRDGVVRLRLARRDRAEPIGTPRSGGNRRIPEANHEWIDSPAQLKADSQGHQARQHFCQWQQGQNRRLWPNSGSQTWCVAQRLWYSTLLAARHLAFLSPNVLQGRHLGIGMRFATSLH